jgi:hypothetical protein
MSDHHSLHDMAFTPTFTPPEDKRDKSPWFIPVGIIAVVVLLIAALFVILLQPAPKTGVAPVPTATTAPTPTYVAPTPAPTAAPDYKSTSVYQSAVRGWAQGSAEVRQLICGNFASNPDGTVQILLSQQSDSALGAAANGPIIMQFLADHCPSGQTA